jgi:hypothetical protein
MLNNILENISVAGEYHNKLVIDQLGRIDIIDDELLMQMRNNNITAEDMDTSYLNFSCTGNSSCC